MQVVVYLANSTPSPIVLKKSLKINGLKLVRYTINGVPVTNGIPNYLFYLLNFNDNSLFLNCNSNISFSGFPLPITGQFTSNELPILIPLREKMNLISPPNLPYTHSTDHIEIQQLNLQLLDSNGNPATFTNACFCFQTF